MKNIAELENTISYVFHNKKYLQTALTHSSYANEAGSGKKNNERMEFLGDSILGAVVADHLFHMCKDCPEGELTKQKALLVCEKALCNYAKQIELGSYLYLSRGEQNSGGRERSSILADAFEAVIAAIYLDGGMEATREFILFFVEPMLNTPRPKVFRDYKTMLQEIVQQNPEEHVEYVLVGESGPDHKKHFVMEVHLNHNVIGKGGGRSKKEAEQQAAREALELMGY